MNLFTVNLIKEKNNVHYKNLVQLEVAITTIKTELQGNATVNLEESFSYNIDVSFSDLTERITSATIEDFIPDYIDFTLPSNVLPSLEIIEQFALQEGQIGKKIIFNFGAIAETGISTSLNINCKFKSGTSNGTTFTNSAILKVDSQPDKIVNSSSITLQLTPNFQLTKTNTINSTTNKVEDKIEKDMLLFNIKSDRDNYGENEKSFKINNVKNTALLGMELSFDIKVKGALDNDFVTAPNIGSTIQGAVNEYKLTITNKHRNSIDVIELVDILPHTGDFQVMSPNTPRNSEFTVYEVSEVKAVFSSSKPSPNLKIEYSKSTNPRRFDANEQLIGTANSWSTTVPNSIIDNRAFKITSLDGFSPGESLIITFKAITPVGAAIGVKAWNSFAIRGSYINPDDPLDFVLISATEPKKIGIEVKKPTLGTGRLGDFVWYDLNGNGIQDSGEPGINGVKVNLYERGSSNILQSTFTANNINNKPGYYLFNHLSRGPYIIQFIKPKGYGFTVKFAYPNNKNSNANINTGLTDVIFVGTGDSPLEELSIDAGLIKLSTIGDRVWEDRNANGIQDNGEPGVPNVIVDLYNSKDLSPTAVIKRTTTDSNGVYSLTGIRPGQYKVKFTKPNGFDFTIKDAISDKEKTSKVDIKSGVTDEIKLISDETNNDIDAGLIPLAKIGNTVWVDKNENGILDLGESGLSNIQVNLYDCTDKTKTNSLYNAITDNNGKYLIENIKIGRYYAVFSKPSGYNFVTAGNLINSNGETNCFTLAPGQEKLDVNAPLIDIKNISVNKTVNLLKAQIGDELTYTITIINNGSLVLTNVTVIDKIPSGTTFINDSLRLNGQAISNVNLNNGLNIKIVQAKETITIIFKVKINNILPNPNPIQNKAIITFDGGLEESPTTITTVEKSSIGNFVWNDLNGNGIQDIGEPGIENIIVNLYKNDLDEPIKTTKTDLNGKYLFDNLRTGEYIVEFIKPSSYDFTIKNAEFDLNKNSKVNIDTGKTDIITLSVNEESLNIDAGMITLGGIKGIAWYDFNENSIKEDAEPGIAGVVVELFNCINGEKTNYSAITDSNGRYNINTIPTGKYFAIFSKVNEFNFVTTNNLVDENGKTPCFNVLAGQITSNIDAPYKKMSCTSTVCGRIINVCDCSPVENLIVYLIKDGKKVAKHCTNSRGIYWFKIEKPGDYFIEFAISKYIHYITERILKINLECHKNLYNICTKVAIKKTLLQ